VRPGVSEAWGVKNGGINLDDNYQIFQIIQQTNIHGELKQRPMMHRIRKEIVWRWG